MTKLIVTFFTLLVLTISSMAQKPETPTWAKTEPYGHEHKTVLQFYFHKRNYTSTLIAEPLHDNGTGVRFGSLFMADEALTIGPDPNSKPVGRAQGLFGRDSMEDGGLIMGLAFIFVDGMYNGSSIVNFGSNPAMNRVRELPIVGGTGLFRMARGYAVAETIWSNPAIFSALVGYNVTIFHA